MKDITFRQIAWGSDEYKQELELRQRVLRKPLGLNLYDEDLDAEQKEYHLCALKEGKVVGIILLNPTTPEAFQMRQVAVDESLQGTGIGRQLVAFSEGVAREKGAKRIFLHARISAQPFYEKTGYHAVGEEYINLGIPHIEMEKDL